MPDVVTLPAADFHLVRPLLVELHEAEQPHFPDHPQLGHAELERLVGAIPSRFNGENIILAVRDGDALAGFCWCVLFDPGTGLEGEVAELYVGPQHRGAGIGRALVEAAVELFALRSVTLGYVWTRGENDVAVRVYTAAGFRPNRQLVLTWYPGTETVSAPASELE